MSDDEMFAGFVSLFAAATLWGKWYARMAMVSTLHTAHASRGTLYLTPVLCLMALWWVLKQFSSHDVRDSRIYMMFYTVMGLAWVGLVSSLVPAWGVSARDDAVERRNPAAALAVGGALLGTTLAFAGGNIGDGPGWWVVVFCAALSTGGLLLAWGLVEGFTHLADAITIERDTASGLRLGAFLLSVGMVLGRCVAGDWESFAATWADFISDAWPVLFLVALEIGFSTLLRPTAEQPHPSPLLAGVPPAFIHVALALFYVLHLGWWE